MSKLRVSGIVFSVLGAAAIAAGAVAYSGANRKASVVADRLAAAQADLDSTRAELLTTGLRYRGYLQGMEAIPDTVRMFGGGIIMDEGKKYDKKIHILEFKERDLNLKITRLKKNLAAGKRHAWMSAAPFLGAGVLMLLAGAVLSTPSRTRPVAP